MKVEDVKPGMKGYGLTVMSGTKPDSFRRGGRSPRCTTSAPARTSSSSRRTHPALSRSRGPSPGMSGSPIYIDGKMIGAYAYGWFFNVEPIAGVTPIKNMLDDLKRPGAQGA